MAYKKSDITFHRDGYSSNRVPAINVKAYCFGGIDATDRLAREFGLTEKRAESLLELAWEWQVADFWMVAEESANEHLAKAFNLPAPFVQREMDVSAEGRSGGWLVVSFKARDSLHGSVNALPDVESWDAVKVRAWGRFVASIEADVKYYSSYDAIKETLEANDKLDPNAERDEARAKAERILAPFGLAVVESVSHD